MERLRFGRSDSTPQAIRRPRQNDLPQPTKRPGFSTRLLTKAKPGRYSTPTSAHAAKNYFWCGCLGLGVTSCG